MRWVQEVVMTRWIELKSTSPSGKVLFVCRYCGSVSPVPDKECAKPPQVYGKDFDQSCKELEGAAVRRLIHPFHMNALLRLTTLLGRLSDATDDKKKLAILRADRSIVTDIVKGVVMQRGSQEHLRIWEVSDDIEEARKELMKK